ncbi:general negative regulator of transcription subunit 5 [Thoreauomyces humboldtii]|nr:general negative regulator of transcription subunit 5 [Thoreauomyces humboldtii]
MANRKLLGEIEKVLKRVAEGVESFRDTFDKLDSAATAAQKEKYEGDLKKEIKKLQRLRDQIRTWLASSDIKDKQSLEDNRRLIEEVRGSYRLGEGIAGTRGEVLGSSIAHSGSFNQQMERFKAAEKALKLKAFSKEGLLQPDKYDPEEQERKDVQEWISETVKELTRQVEVFEAEQESLQLLMKKGRKGGDPAKQERLAAIDHALERHKWHMVQLEITHRMVANEELNVDQVKEIKEDVDYYVKSNQDPDFDENEYVYEDLDLENLEAYGLKMEGDGDGDTNGDAPQTPTEKEIPDVLSPVREVKHEESTKKKSVKEKADPPDDPVTPTKPTKRASASKTPIAIKTPAKAVPSRPLLAPALRVQELPPAQHHITQRYSTAAAASTPVPIVETPVRSTATSSSAAVPASAKQQIATKQTPISSQPNPPSRNVSGSSSSAPSAPTPVSKIIPEPPKDDSVPEPIDNRLPPTLADLVQSFEATRDRSTATNAKNDHGFLREMLQTSFQFLPDPLDSAKPAHHIPSNPYPVPDYYPQLASPMFENPTVFEKFDTDVLFFIFYYQQGTYQQYLAARELKRQSWRFHKKYLTWFQRHEEPQQITDEYETGTYVYFDYEGAWCQRKKTDFRFEYRFLEDAEM